MPGRSVQNPPQDDRNVLPGGHPPAQVIDDVGQGDERHRGHCGSTALRGSPSSGSTPARPCTGCCTRCRQDRSCRDGAGCYTPSACRPNARPARRRSRNPIRCPARGQRMTFRTPLVRPQSPTSARGTVVRRRQGQAPACRVPAAPWSPRSTLTAGRSALRDSIRATGQTRSAVGRAPEMNATWKRSSRRLSAGVDLYAWSTARRLVQPRLTGRSGCLRPSRCPRYRSCTPSSSV